MKELAVKLSIDGGESIKQTQAIENNLEAIDKSIEEINSTGLGGFEKAMADADTVVKSGNASMRDLSKVIKQYESIAMNAGASSPIGREALERAAALKDEIGDLRASVTNLAKDGQALQTALQLGQGITAGYTAFKSVTALVGVENEALMETMVKLQAAQAALVSIEQIRATLEKQSLVTLKAREFWTKAIAFSTTLFARAQGGATAATATATVGVRAFTAALIATGIGAIVVGIGLLIANLDKVRDAFVWLSEKVMEGVYWFDRLGTGVKIAIAVFFPFIGVIWGVIEALKAFGVMDDEATAEMKKNAAIRIKAIEQERDQVIKAKEKEREALQALYDEESAARQHQLNVAKALGKDTVELEREILDKKVEFTEKSIELLSEQIKAEKKAQLEIMRAKAQTDSFMAGLLTNIEKEISKAGGEESFLNKLVIGDDGIQKLKADLNKATQEVEVFEANQTRIKREAAQKQADQAAAIADKAAQDELKRREELAKAIAEQMERERELAEEMRMRSLDDEERALAEREKQLQRELEMAGNNLELQKALRREYEQDILSIQEHYDEERDKMKEAKDKKEADALLAKRNLELQTASQVLGGIAAMTEVFGKKNEAVQRKAFTVKKAADISAATLDGTRAVLNAFATTPAPFNIAAAAAAGLFATAQIAKIAQTQFQGGATSVSAGVPSAVDTSPVGAANRDNIGNNNTTNTQNLLNGGGGGQVLVVDSLSKVAADVNKINVVGSV
jgi:hypothetical protein